MAATATQFLENRVFPSLYFVEHHLNEEEWWQ
jgi:hypothetical protein